MNPYLLPIIEMLLRRRDRRKAEQAKKKEPKVDNLDIDQIERQLVRDEGMRLKPYKDSVGKLTIGVGRNLDDNGISDAEAQHLLRNDVNQAMRECMGIPCFSHLNAPRQAVLVNMCFNIGLSRLMGFKKMLAALDAKNYQEAGVQMMDSKWAKQVGIRAVRLYEQMLKGEWVN